MKTISALLILMALTVSVSFARTKEPKTVKVISDKQHTVFIKVDKSFVGGTIKVYNADGKFLEAEELPHTHTKVFFDEAPAGNYIIKVIKGNQSLELEYHNF